MLLYIKTLTGKTISLDIESQEYIVAEIKRQILAKTGTPIKDQHIICAGMELLDTWRNEQIQEHAGSKIEHGSVIHLVISGNELTKRQEEITEEITNLAVHKPLSPDVGHERARHFIELLSKLPKQEFLDLEQSLQEINLTHTLYALIADDPKTYPEDILEKAFGLLSNLCEKGHPEAFMALALIEYGRNPYQPLDAYLKPIEKIARGSSFFSQLFKPTSPNQRIAEALLNPSYQSGTTEANMRYIDKFISAFQIPINTILSSEKNLVTKLDSLSPQEASIAIRNELNPIYESNPELFRKIIGRHPTLLQDALSVIDLNVLLPTLTQFEPAWLTRLIDTCGFNLTNLLLTRFLQKEDRVLCDVIKTFFESITTQPTKYIEMLMAMAIIANFEKDTPKRDTYLQRIFTAKKQNPNHNLLQVVLCKTVAYLPQEHDKRDVNAFVATHRYTICELLANYNQSLDDYSPPTQTINGP